MTQKCKHLHNNYDIKFDKYSRVEKKRILTTATVT